MSKSILKDGKLSEQDELLYGISLFGMRLSKSIGEELNQVRDTLTFGRKEREIFSNIENALNTLEEILEALKFYSISSPIEVAYSDTDLVNETRELIDVYRRRYPDSFFSLEDKTFVPGRYPVVAVRAVLEILLDNATRFTGDGKASRVSLRASRKDDFVMLTVADQGIGIPEEQQERIFEPFTRLHTRRFYPGAGLGLYTAKKILSRIGGSLQVSSEPGQGSAFRLSLPVDGQATSLESGIEAELLSFTRLLAHDLRSPLRAIFSYTLLLQSEAGVNQKTRQSLDNLDKITSSFEEMLESVIHYISYSVDFQTAIAVELESALMLAKSRLQDLIAQSKMKITHQPLPIIPGKVEAMTLMFEYLLRYLLKNNAPGLDPKVKISTQKKEERHLISLVSNSSIFQGSPQGISFYAFYYTDDSNEVLETGLDLATAATIIHSYGGKMEITSLGEKGIQIKLDFPATESQKPK